MGMVGRISFDVDDKVKGIIEESKKALFSLLIQFTDGEAKNMLFAHARRNSRNAY